MPYRRTSYVDSNFQANTGFRPLRRCVNSAPISCQPHKQRRYLQIKTFSIESTVIAAARSGYRPNHPRSLRPLSCFDSRPFSCDNDGYLEANEPMIQSSNWTIPKITAGRLSIYGLYYLAHTVGRISQCEMVAHSSTSLT